MLRLFARCSDSRTYRQALTITSTNSMIKLGKLQLFAVFHLSQSASHTYTNIRYKANFALEQATKTKRYSCTLSLTLALDRVVGQHYTPANLPSGKSGYPLYRKLSGPQGRSGWVQKISPSPGFGPRTIYPAASRYTDCWAIPATIHVYVCVCDSPMNSPL
jgi:hypothetical protein